MHSSVYTCNVLQSHPPRPDRRKRVPQLCVQSAMWWSSLFSLWLNHQGCGQRKSYCLRMLMYSISRQENTCWHVGGNRSCGQRMAATDQVLIFVLKLPLRRWWWGCYRFEWVCLGEKYTGRANIVNLSRLQFCGELWSQTGSRLWEASSTGCLLADVE